MPARATPIDLPAVGRVNAEIADAIMAEIGGAAEIARHLHTIMREAVIVNSKGIEATDYRTRLAAAQLALHYVVGKPVERQQILTANVGPTDSDLIERLAHSPALRAAIRDAVEAAEKTSV